jgi:hypothetical protein
MHVEGENPGNGNAYGLTKIKNNLAGEENPAVEGIFLGKYVKNT